MYRGTRYHIVESGPLEAVERVRFERPVLVILDLMMPGRTGFEVLDELKTDPATRNIPVVIHTSKSLTEADRFRLADRHLALLPKSSNNRAPALSAIREVLGNPNLFADEPEFANTRSRVSR